MEASPTSRELAAQIRTELADAAPEGLAFSDHVVRQNSALERLVTQLKSHENPGEVGHALGHAVNEERDGWTLLKLLEACEQLQTLPAAPALMALAKEPPGSGDRARFLAGRACEVLLKLPLDYPTRLVANEVCKGPLGDINRFRMGAERARTLHRPRRVEWTLLVVLMAIGLAGFIYVMATLR
ncbi:MAG: hypothetical protein ACOZIN_18135 [Myxococcota bacterium]